MRKIEHQMVNAIIGKTNWESANTMVETVDGVSKVYLHNNLIATITGFGVTLYDGGYRSSTTKSRLNAILFAFNGGWSVFQNNFEWFVRDYTISQPFHSGYVLAF